MKYGCQGLPHKQRFGFEHYKYFRESVGCAPEFSYYWFPSLTYGDDNKTVSTDWNNPDPNDSASRLMFVLPAADISKRKCSPSPFINAGHQSDPEQPRSGKNLLGLPTLCANDMTRSVVQFIGSGPYQANKGSSTAELSLDKDNDTISCSVNWADDATLKLITKHIYITVRTGPIFDTDAVDFSGDPVNPSWVARQIDLYEDSIDGSPTKKNISLRAALPDVNWTSNRVIGCMIEALDPLTTLPVTVNAPSKVLLNGIFPWRDFKFPIYTKPCEIKGCITTIASNWPGPGMLTAGRALNWLGYENRSDVIFVALEGTGIKQFAPPLPRATNFSEVLNENVEAKLIKDAGIITGFQVDNQGDLVVVGNFPCCWSPPGAALRYIAKLSWANGSYATQGYLGKGRVNCYSVVDRNGADSWFFYTSGGWLNSTSGDLWFLDAGQCTKLFRAEAGALDLSCPSLGLCGKLRALADLGATAELRGWHISDFQQNVYLAADPQRDILYASYGLQCGVMALGLRNGSRIGWTVAASKKQESGQYIPSPRCGYAGDGGLAAGENAALGRNIGQMAVDSSGNLYIADTGVCPYSWS